MSRWFRHYAGMMRDDKLVSVSIKSKQSVERVVWVWGAILESAAELDDEGSFEVDAAEISRFLRCKESAINSIIEALAHADRIAEGKVSKWLTRQYKSDKSNGRVAAYRARKRNGSNNGETLHVTLPERDGNAPETETETEVPLAKANALDPEKVMFDSGLAVLTAAGTSPAKARPLLGKWKRDHGAAAVIEALGAAQRHGVIDPVGWIEGRWRKQRSSVNASAEMPLV
jgi:hypothetical protein